MRRPLPNSKGAETPQIPANPEQGGDEDGENENPSPNPDPVSPGFKYEPEIMPPSEDPFVPPGLGDYKFRFTYGAWSGPSQCGQQSRLTRTIGCELVQEEYDDGGGVTLGSFNGEITPVPLNQMPGAKIQNAQLGSVSIQAVNIEQCLNDSSAMAAGGPINVYEGEQAGCGANPIIEGTDWSLEPYAYGNPYCSDGAIGHHSFRCSDDQGNPVSNQFCVENVQSGGMRNTSLIEPMRGNYSGCTARWYGMGNIQGCEDENGQNGPTNYADFTYKCVRSDGIVINDESACTEPKPQEGIKAVGSCRQNYMRRWDHACVTNGDLWETTLRLPLNSETDFDTVGVDACIASGASCCSLRQVRNDRYSGAPNGRFEAVGTGAPHAQEQPNGFYFDDPDRRIGTGEGPLFLAYVGGELVYTPRVSGTIHDDTGEGEMPRDWNGDDFGGPGPL